MIPGVEVTLTNERTNISRSTVTNERGEYMFANIDPGSYMLKATLTGYKTIERREIPLGTQQFITLDLTMEVGAIEENITVTGQSPIIETSNASQGTVLDSQALNALPSPGRAAFLIGARCRRWSPRETRSSTGSRIRPTRRCCRSAAARAAATTTRSTACRSPT